MVSRNRSSNLFLIIICYLLAYFQSAVAAEITKQNKSDSTISLIKVHGPINAGDDEIFNKISLNVSKAVVVLDGPGGVLGTALNIGESVRRRGYITAVQHGERCVSSCALIWLAGREKYAEHTSKIAFHGAYIIKDDRKTESAVFNALVGAYLSKLGYGNNVIVYVSQAPPDRLEYLTPATAKSLGINYKSLNSKNDL